MLRKEIQLARWHRVHVFRCLSYCINAEVVEPTKIPFSGRRRQPLRQIPDRYPRRPLAANLCNLIRKTKSPIADTEVEQSPRLNPRNPRARFDLDMTRSRRPTLLN